MKVGVFVPLNARNTNGQFLRTLGPAVEERGFESIWAPEHVVLFDDYESRYPYSDSGKFPGRGDTGVLEPFTALTYLAAVTERLRLGTGICLVPQRNPVYTAKQVADLDVLSGGRVEFGIGIGWLREEFDSLNVPFERRGQRTDEYLEVMRSLWLDETSSYSGEMYQLTPCRLYPKPAQKPHPPVLVGGESEAAMRRAARFGQGWFTFNRAPDDFAVAYEALDRHLADAGRSRQDDFTVTTCPYMNAVTTESIDGYRAAGVDRLIVVTLARGSDDLLRNLDQLVADVLEPVQAVS
jgi:probable F420-dependent oxidoreductase